jgi:hypothetical protein
MFGQWLSNGVPPTGTPWFCAVSFVNPHDMTTFPYGFGIYAATQGLGTFTNPETFSTTNPPPPGFAPPPSGNGSPGYPVGGAENVQPFLTLFAQNSSGPVGPFGSTHQPPLQPWNCVSTDSPENLQYVQSPPSGKPTLQYWYLNQHGNEVGAPQDTNAWLTFLNYYYWLQNNVDYQVSRVFSALNTYTTNNPGSAPIVIFTSDHGDYSGSHYLPGKGWGLYDEAINVPLYIMYPGQQNPLGRPYACSSVDILPFIYDTALGNHSWRNNTGDLVYYLANRESITDFINGQQPAQQHRVTTTIQWAAYPSQYAYNEFQPYILHTTDEGFKPYTNPANGDPIPGHAIAFRTVDYSLGPLVPTGGGKLGMYSLWSYAGSTPTQPETGTQFPQQFEFYYYSNITGSDLQANYGETGNQYALSNGNQSLESIQWQSNFSEQTVYNELYKVPQQAYISQGYSAALSAYLKYVNASQKEETDPDTTWQT